ncbi:MAG: DUF3052 domain-containing protein [Actinomycetota bacterium]
MPGDKDYSSTPLAKKLGIDAGSSVAVLSAPEGFEGTLGPLPTGARLRTRAGSRENVILFFTTRSAELGRRFGWLMRRLDPAGGLWIAWPKKSSDIAHDLSFEEVQRIGLEAGLVDNKSCSVDTNWQALRFVYRLKDRP